MEIIVAAYAVVIVIHCFAGMWKMARWNNDPRQQQLVQSLIAAGRSGDIADSNNVTDFLSKQGDWRLGEHRRRLAHARTVVERMVEPPVYKRANDIALNIGQGINRQTSMLRRLGQFIPWWFFVPRQYWHLF
jgi:hypothetical protein